jgi:two-component system LytT family response regulator
VNKFRALIVEDEPLAREKLRCFIHAEPDIALVAECADGRSAVDAIRTYRPEMVFLDVRLPGMTGFEVLKTVPESLPAAVIFVTAFDGFAIRAFESGATDYLLKPFNRDRFREAVERARTRIIHTRSSPPAQWLRTITDRVGGRQIISLKTGARFVLVPADDIEVIVATRSCCTIYTASERFEIRRTLAAIVEELNSDEFVQINRSTVVNDRHVREIIRKNHGDAVVLLNSGGAHPLSRRYRGRWRHIIGNLGK